MITLAIKRLCRILTNSRYNMPVTIIDGNAPPRVTGTAHHYKTRGGGPIYHPSAYSKKGWSNMIYNHSTISIEVGEEWVKENLWANYVCATPECYKKEIREIIINDFKGMYNEQ